jgi:hypothetical protein
MGVRKQKGRESSKQTWLGGKTSLPVLGEAVWTVIMALALDYLCERFFPIRLPCVSIVPVGHAFVRCELLDRLLLLEAPTAVNTDDQVTQLSIYIAASQELSRLLQSARREDLRVVIREHAEQQ